jgi:hypothetical protein
LAPDIVEAILGRHPRFSWTTFSTFSLDFAAVHERRAYRMRALHHRLLPTLGRRLFTGLCLMRRLLERTL